MLGMPKPDVTPWRIRASTSAAATLTAFSDETWEGADIRSNEGPEEHSRGRLHPIVRKTGAQWRPRRLCHTSFTNQRKTVEVVHLHRLKALLESQAHAE